MSKCIFQKVKKNLEPLCIAGEEIARCVPDSDNCVADLEERNDAKKKNRNWKQVMIKSLVGR